MDIDGDGHTDILSGSYSRMEGGMAGLFQVLRGTKEGFLAPEPLTCDQGDPLIITPLEGAADPVITQICTRPTAVDLNGDGELDIVSGNFEGTFALFHGSEDGFDPDSVWLKGANGKPLRVEMHSDPFFVDWDGDGDQDLLSGSVAGGVVMFPNVGTKTEPAFGKKVQLTPDAPGGGFDMSTGLVLGEAHIKGPQGSTRVVAADVNGDGKLDLLVGDQATIKKPAEGLTDEECRAAFEKWYEEFQVLMESAPEIEDWESMSDEDEAAMEAHQEEFAAHMEKRAEFMTEWSTGFVWYFEST